MGVEERPFPFQQATRLEVFLKRRGIRPAHLSRESGYRRQDVFGVRMGRIIPGPNCMSAITNACMRLSGERLEPSDLFDFGAHAAGQGR
jgi:hypothetical protein